MKRLRSAVVLVGALCVVAAACGGGDATGDATTTTATATTVPATTTMTPTTTTVVTTTMAPTTTAAATTTVPTTTVAGGDDGAPIDFFFRDGDTLGVIGVASDDALNVRSGAGVDNEVVAALDPLADDVVATGGARQLASGAIWVEVSARGTTGWANSAFLAYLGRTDDITAEIVDRTDEPPVGDTPEDVALGVADLLASTEPPSEITVVSESTSGDVEDVTVDVVGLGDDAVRGLRLVVFVVPEGDGYTMRTVERTFLCGRGLSEELCV